MSDQRTLPRMVNDDIDNAIRRNTKAQQRTGGISITSAGGRQATVPTAPDAGALELDEHLADTTPHAGHVEPALGNPEEDGQVLVSTAAGVRSWADAPTGTGSPILAMRRSWMGL